MARRVPALVAVAVAACTAASDAGDKRTSVTLTTTGSDSEGGTLTGSTPVDPNGTGGDPNAQGGSGEPQGTIPGTVPAPIPGAKGLSVMTAQTNLCMAVQADYTLELAICDGSSGQRFQLTQQSLRSLTGTCLDISGGTAVDGVPAVFATCAQAFSRASQQWSLGSGLLRNATSGNATGAPCLGYTGNGGTGSAVVLRTSTDNCARMVVGYDGASLQVAGTTTCLTSAGTRVGVAGCDQNSAAQLWTFSSAGEIRLSGTSTCLDASSGIGNKSPLVLGNCSGGATQGWTWNAAFNDLRPHADGSNTLFVDQVSGIFGSSIALSNQKPYGPAFAVVK